MDGQIPPRFVLLVEDNEQLRTLYRMILDDAGFRVVAVPAAVDALAHGGRIDLLVTDLSLPGMDGYELARRLRAQRPDLPVLFTSGWARTAAPDTAVPRSAFLGKPFGRSELLGLVDALLRTSAHA